MHQRHQFKFRHAGGRIVEFLFRGSQRPGILDPIALFIPDLPEGRFFQTWLDRSKKAVAILGKPQRLFQRGKGSDPLPIQHNKVFRLVGDQPLVNQALSDFGYFVFRYASLFPD